MLEVPCHKSILPALLAVCVSFFPSVAPGSGETLAGTELAELRLWAEAELADVAQRRSALSRIRTEPDAMRRAALWSQWLSGLPRDVIFHPDERQALKHLAEQLPRALVAHHEFPGATMPAFAVSERAEAWLRRDRINVAAQALADDPQALLRILSGEASDVMFEAGLVALESVPDAVRAALIVRYRASGWPKAEQVMLRIVALDSGRASVLVDVVRRGAAADAHAALRYALDEQQSLPAALLRRMAEAGLRRTAPAGLALQVWRSADGDSERLWKLLGRPGIGADAARVLAADHDYLVGRIGAEIEAVPVPARLHMLLALKLRGGPEARALLAELVQAPWLSVQQRREIGQWL